MSQIKFALCLYMYSARGPKKGEDVAKDRHGRVKKKPRVLVSAFNTSLSCILSVRAALIRQGSVVLFRKWSSK